MSKPKELKLYKCWECNGSYYASEMTTTDKKKEVGDFCKECWKDIKELADPFLDEYLQEIQEKKNKPEHWIKVYEANIGHHEMLDDFSAVLRNMGIDAFNDEEQAEKEGVDLFIVLEKQEKK